MGWIEKDFESPTVLDIWSFRKKDKFIENDIIKIVDIDADDMPIKKDDEPGISPSERQWLQVKKIQDSDNTFWIDKENLQRENILLGISTSFIDFETTMVAIPFNKGRRPYEGIAFQFSHHIVYADGRVEHKGEFLNIQRGIFPNYEFLRALKKELEQDKGSIFRYSNHENTFLNHIYTQLVEDESNIPTAKNYILLLNLSPNPLAIVLRHGKDQEI